MLKMPPMTSLVGATIRNKHDSTCQYGEVIRFDRKKRTPGIYEMQYRYLDERIKCTMQCDVAMYDGKLYTMLLIGGRGGHWVKSWEIEIVETAPVIQQTLF